MAYWTNGLLDQWPTGPMAYWTNGLPGLVFWYCWDTTLRISIAIVPGGPAGPMAYKLSPGIDGLLALAEYNPKNLDSHCTQWPNGPMSYQDLYSGIVGIPIAIIPNGPDSYCD